MASPCQPFHPPGLYLRSAAVTSIDDTRVAVVAVDPGSDGAGGLRGTAPARPPLSSAPTAPARPGPAGGALLPPASATAHPRGREGGAGKALRAPGSAQNARQVTAPGTGTERQHRRERGGNGRDAIPCIGGTSRDGCMDVRRDVHMCGKPRSLVLKVAAQR